jgi:hypothetical protein
MAPAEYCAWVLILQCSAYVNLLDLGLQTATGKFVAEYNALDDRLASGVHYPFCAALLGVETIDYPSANLSLGRCVDCGHLRHCWFVGLTAVERGRLKQGLTTWFSTERAGLTLCRCRLTNNAA